MSANLRIISRLFILYPENLLILHQPALSLSPFKGARVSGRILIPSIYPHMSIRNLLILTFLFIFLPLRGAGEPPSLSLDVRPSYAFPSYLDDVISDILDIENAKKTEIATSIHLQYGFSFPRESRQGRICPDAWQGLGASVNFLGNPKGIGTPVSVYAFQGAPIWRFSEKLSLYYEWNFGASFGWRPTRIDPGSESSLGGAESVSSQSNLVVGSRVNAYICLGTGLRYRLSRSLALIGGLELTHYSNGNTSFPNPGVNLAGLRLGVVGFIGRHDDDVEDGREGSNFPALAESNVGCPTYRRPRVDLTLYGSLRKRVYRGGEEPVLLNSRFAVAGLDIAPMWRITRNFRTGPSLDLQWDESTDLKRHYLSGTTSGDILFTRPPFFSQVCVGLSGRAELVMPIFSVNVGIGYNFIGPEETRASYQLANLKVRLSDAFFLNIGYQLLNFRKQNNLMLGIGYSI